jgi:hypothetical protein
MPHHLHQLIFRCNRRVHHLAFQTVTPDNLLFFIRGATIDSQFGGRVPAS